MSKNLHSTTCDSAPHLGGGVYTVPDVARILKIPMSKTRRWIGGYWGLGSEGHRRRYTGAIESGSWGIGRDRAVNFLALIEIYTFAALRNEDYSAQHVMKAHQELCERFDTMFPFAYHRLLIDGSQIFVALEESTEGLLTLRDGGQTVFKKVIEPFCKKIDFCNETSLAEKYWPLGKKRTVVVDPHRGFGRPTISETNITTESIAHMVSAGEPRQFVSEMYDIPEAAVRDAIEFEHEIAA